MGLVSVAGWGAVQDFAALAVLLAGALQAGVYVTRYYALMDIVTVVKCRSR